MMNKIKIDLDQEDIETLFRLAGDADMSPGEFVAYLIQEFARKGTDE